jgi:hypothetical protein
MVSLPANLKNFADKEGRVVRLPVKWAKKLELAEWLLLLLEPNTRYSELELNAIFETYVDDFALMRRLLVDTGKLNRELDCSAYWRN